MIKDELHKKLPSYMVPAFIKRLDEMPINANGKIDRIALKKPCLSDFKKEYIMPVSDSEKEICKAFEEILKCKQVGLNDDFFDLGGDSIKILVLRSKCENYDFTATDALEGRTPAAISKKCKKPQEIDEVKNSTNEYPLTSSERGMYIEQKMAKESVSYNLNIVINFNGVSYA